MHIPAPGSLEAVAAAKPEHVAFYEGDLKVTWAEWNRAADLLAHGLRRLGIQPGDRLAVRTTVRWEWFVIYLALSKLGAAAVGLNAKAPPEEAEYLIADSGVRGVILDDADPTPIVEIARRQGLTVNVAFHGSDAPLYADLTQPAEVGPLFSQAPAALILYTSGTTGRPKGVALDPGLLVSRPNVQAYREHMARLVPVSETSCFLLNLPLHHGAGPNSALFTLRAGGSVAIQPKFDPLDALQLIARHQVTNWMAVPTMVHRMAALPEAEREAHDRSSVRAVNIGAASVPASLKAWAADFFGLQCRLFEGYGMTETQMISYMLPEDCATKPDSSGRPLPYVDVKIIDPEGLRLGADQTGEICVRTPLMIDRYLNRPPLGPEDLTEDGYFRTGDVGRLDEDGYLYVTDRIKDMIIVGGANVYPAEVEAILNTHPHVLEAAVIGVPHPDLGEQVMAICEMKPGAPQDPDDLIAHCRRVLAPFKTPRIVDFTPELPRNATGKVTKPVLRAPHWAGRERQV